MFLCRENDRSCFLPVKYLCLTLFLLFYLASSLVAAQQFSVYEGKSFAEDNKIRLYKYYLKYLGRKDYAAPVVATSNNGIILIGDIDSDKLTRYKYYTKLAFIIKFAENGELAWSTELKPKGMNLQSMGIIEDFQGNYLVFILEHKALGSPGQMRVLKLKEGGGILWDIMLGKSGGIQRLHANMIMKKKDGRSFLLTGHIYPDQDAFSKETAYVWEAELDTSGKIIKEKIGGIFKLGFFINEYYLFAMISPLTGEYFSSAVRLLCSRC